MDGEVPAGGGDAGGEPGEDVRMVFGVYIDAASAKSSARLAGCVAVVVAGIAWAAVRRGG